MNRTRAAYDESLFSKKPYKPLPSLHRDVVSSDYKTTFPFIPPPDYKEYHIHDRANAHTVNFPYIPHPDYSQTQFHLWPRDQAPPPMPNHMLEGYSNANANADIYASHPRNGYQRGSSRFVSTDRSSRRRNSGSQYPFYTYGVPKYVETALQHGPIIPTVFTPGGYNVGPSVQSPAPQNYYAPTPPRPVSYGIPDNPPVVTAPPPPTQVVYQEPAPEVVYSEPNVDPNRRYRIQAQATQPGLYRHLQEHRRGDTLRSGVEFMHNCPICHAASTADLLLQKDPEKFYNRQFMIKEKQATLRNKDFKGHRQLEFLDELRSLQALTARVSQDRVARSSQELTVRRGEYLEVFDSDRDWFSCANVNGQTGLVPVDVLKLIIWERVEDMLDETPPPRRRRRSRQRILVDY